MEMKGNENVFTYKHLQDVEHPQCDNSEHCSYECRDSPLQWHLCHCIEKHLILLESLDLNLITIRLYLIQILTMVIIVSDRFKNRTTIN
jgi:hypothetical protein